MRKCVFCAADVADDASECSACGRLLPAETTAVSVPLCFTTSCEQCGSTIDVYEESYWKTLTCESCGHEFVGKPPMGEPFDDPTPEPRGKRWGLIVGGLIVVAAVALALIAWLR